MNRLRVYSYVSTTAHVCVVQYYRVAEDDEECVRGNKLERYETRSSISVSTGV
jgi:hypothetical protein